MNPFLADRLEEESVDECGFRNDTASHHNNAHSKSNSNVRTRLSQSKLTFQAQRSVLVVNLEDASTSSEAQRSSTAQTSDLVQPEPQKNNKRSVVWGFYKDLPQDKNSHVKICVLCKKEVKTSRNTTNARYHLEKNHPIDLELAESKNHVLSSCDSTDEGDDAANVSNTTSAKRYANGAMKTKNSSETNVVEHTDEKSKKKMIACETKNQKPRQASLKTILKRKQKQKQIYDPNSPKKIKLDRLLLQLVVLDFQPFSIVNDQGFVEFVNELDPRYKLPCANTLSTTLLSKYYKLAKEKMDNILKDSGFLAITYDTWTSLANHCYLTLTGHFIQGITLQKCTLSFVESSESHESDKLSKLIADELNSISNVKITGCVSDNAKNMIATAKKLNFEHIPCFVHSIQLVIRDAILDCSPTILKEKMLDKDKNFDIGSLLADLTSCAGNETTAEVSVPIVLQKVKRIAMLFNQSPKTVNALRKELKSRGLEDLSLIQEVCTRWNSAFAMLKRFDDLKDPITIVLAKVGKANFLMLEEELQIISDLILALEPFIEITKVMSQESVPTISLIVPYISGIIETLNDIIKDQLTTDIGKSFARCLISQTKRRLSYYETSTVASLATVLDHRFKRIGFSSVTAYDRTVEMIRERLKRIAKENQRDTDTVCNDDNSQSQFAPKGILSKLFSKVPSKNLKPATSTKKINSSASMIVKFDDYLNEPRKPFEETNKGKLSKKNFHILEYWSNHEFKELAQIPQETLVIPGSSVSSERDCSTAEYTINKRRARLQPEKVKRILYLNRNLKFVEPNFLICD